MQVRDLTYKDYFREALIFSVVICSFYFSPEKFSNVIYWFLWMITILTFIAFLGNKEIAYTKRKASFEIYTILLLCAVIVYFGYYILASILFFISGLFISSCVNNLKKINND